MMTRSTYLRNVSEEDQVPDSDDGLLVHDIQLLGDGSGKETAAEDCGASLGDEVGGRREFVDDLRRALGGWLLARHSSTKPTPDASIFSITVELSAQLGGRTHA